MMRVFNDIACHVDQGNGKRKGREVIESRTDSHFCAFAVYLQPWQGGVFEFLDLRKNHGKEEQFARDTLYALLVTDLFMKMV
ncbi:hypothetical protein Nepgr_018998 [Nepenthes gracilis]|uniref:Ribonucleotide reductase large subunit C-terminal domain-containing protein n=1 Tax=Nepenthes gracilis TaxID=150966 RepID=A0AAD3XTM8_NEPGR|nr:hypothetical protein Nepgr_018998 [Nepenthes gracilis]